MYTLISHTPRWTQCLFTSEPGLPPAYNRDRCYFEGGFYSGIILYDNIVTVLQYNISRHYPSPLCAFIFTAALHKPNSLFVSSATFRSRHHLNLSSILVLDLTTAMRRNSSAMTWSWIKLWRRERARNSAHDQVHTTATLSFLLTLIQFSNFCIHLYVCIMSCDHTPILLVTKI